ncbi:LLM class flavin-dependent oxidoreductase [Streptomyces sp. WMMC500]|uniref:LLM class flavin-dependent oxidoreductase n=1 Tax=Streptomyces sp. WMMC500 TaxID=3015154 RepID=UPI00248CC9C2|nr:LLM class flavin-dependent oxidoreductase [Streptomyces sp. WMMC500]WBB61442.1 LLM class flavin-dependent oxidoreductase [Streptomyces sp. WMMC500]
MAAQLHLSAALDDATAARRPAGACPPPPYARWTRLVRLAEQGGLDFVTLDGAGGPGRLDVPAVLALAAGTTSRIGLVPAVAALPSGRLAPLTSAVARSAVDGRTGWLVRTALPGDGPFGTRAHTPGAHGAPGRHHAARRHRSGARPRRPHRPPVAMVLDVHGPDRRWLQAARYADVVLLDAEHPAAAQVCRAALKHHAADAGRDPRTLRVLLRLGVDLGRGGGRGLRPRAETLHFAGPPAGLAGVLAEWHAEGVADGFHLLPAHAATDLLAVVYGLVPRLRERGVFRSGYRGRTLREHLAPTA